MFHAQCWDQYLSNHSRRSGELSPRFGCPNCRGAGSIIAVWNYIDRDRVTQDIGTFRAENLLETNATFHSINTPDSQRSPSVYTPRSVDEVRSFYTESRAYHIQTRLPDGRPALIVDPGSVGNLCGDKWAKEVAIAANKSGHRPTYEKRPRPLHVSGVGNGAQECRYDCKLPVAFRQLDGKTTSPGQLTTPAVFDSSLPGLLGRMALTNNRAIMTMSTTTSIFVGPATSTYGGPYRRALKVTKWNLRRQDTQSSHVASTTREQAAQSTRSR